jgi:CRP-like cAMP-binding protein
MNSSESTALRLFVSRLASRSLLTDAEKNAILGLTGLIKQVKAHVDFVGYGEMVDNSCLVVDGCVGRFRQSREGARQITCLYIPGDVADLASVMSPKSAWGLSALTKTTVLQIPCREIRRIAANHPGVAEALWRDCVADGSIFSEWVVNVGHRDALSRLAHLICELAVRFERTGKGDKQSFPLPITQTDLGEATGLTSVHVNRTLRELRTRSVAEMHAGTVTIHDWDQLVTIGEFDPAFMLLDGPAPRITEPA